MPSEAQSFIIYPDSFVFIICNNRIWKITAKFVQCIKTTGGFFTFEMLREAPFSFKISTASQPLSSRGNEFHRLTVFQKILLNNAIFPGQQQRGSVPTLRNGCLGKPNQAGLIGAGFTLLGKVKGLTIFRVIIHAQTLNMGQKEQCSAPLYHKLTATGFVCMQKPYFVHGKTP